MSVCCVWRIKFKKLDTGFDNVYLYGLINTIFCKQTNKNTEIKQY